MVLVIVQGLSFLFHLLLIQTLYEINAKRQKLIYTIHKVTKNETQSNEKCNITRLNVDQ